MFMNKVENFVNVRMIKEFLYRLDIIRNLKANPNIDRRYMKFAMDEKRELNYYSLRLMPNAYNDFGMNYNKNRQHFNIDIDDNKDNNNDNYLNNNNNIIGSYKGSQIGASNISEKLSLIGSGANIKGSLINNNYLNANKFNNNNNNVNNLNSNNNIINIKSNFYNKYSTIKPLDSEIHFYQENNNNVPIKTTILSNENLNGKEMFSSNIKHNLNFNFNKQKYNSIVQFTNLKNNINKTRIKTLKPCLNNNKFINNLNNFKSPTISNDNNTIMNNNNLSVINNFDYISQDMKNKINEDLNLNIFNKILKIGDVVLIRYKYKILYNSKDYVNTEGILYPEKIINKHLICLPLNKLEKIRGGKSIFKRSLFRIENAQNYNFQTNYDNMRKILKNKYKDEKKKISKEEEKNLKELLKLSNEEKKGNQSEFMLNYNNTVAYGQNIQLRNLFTNELLIIDESSISNEIGCMDVKLNPLGGRIAWFKLMPNSKIRYFGEAVSYTDNLFIVPSSIDNSSYLHVNSNINNNNKINNIDNKGYGMEVNISNQSSLFKFSLFYSAEEILNQSDKNVINSTSVVKIYNEDFNGFLCANIKNYNEILPRLKTDKKMDINENEEIKNNYGDDISDNNNNINKNSNNEGGVNANLNNSTDYANSVIQSSKININNNNPESNNKLFRINTNNNLENKQNKSNKRKNSLINNNDKIKSLNFNNYENNFKNDDNNKSLINITENNLNDSFSSQISVNINKLNYYQISFDYSSPEIDDCNYYWEIQYEKPYEGKTITCGCPIRLCHIASGLYLSFNEESNEISLSNTLDNQTVFYIFSDNQLNNFNKSIILDQNQVYFCAKNTELFIKIDESKKMIGKKHNLILSKEDKMEYEKMLFKIQLQNHSLVRVNYNATLIIHHLLNLFEEINSWGIRVIGDELRKVYVYDYYVALNKEKNLEEMINVYKKILYFIKEDSYDNKPGNVHFKNYQNFHNKQGLIFILLNYILLFDKKSIEYENNNNFNLKINKDNVSAEKIAAKYTASAIDLSFEIIKILIDNNENSPKAIYFSINIINQLFDSHRLEIIQILIICLKQNNKNLIIKNKFMQIYFWQSKLVDIDESLNNLYEQTLYIKIITKLTLNDNGEEGELFKNQMEIKLKLFDIDIIPLKFGIDENEKPFVCINSKMSYEEFFKKNVLLSEIKNIKINFKNEPIFYYTDISKQKFEKYIDYICAVLDLYFSACVNRNQININIISNSKSVGLTINHIWHTIINPDIDLKIRIRYLKLFRVLYIDCEPYTRLSKYGMKIFFWNIKKQDKSNLLNMVYSWLDGSLKKFRKRMETQKDKFEFLNIYIKNFFVSTNKITNLCNFDSFDDLRKDKNAFLDIQNFVKEIFILTQEIIDFGFLNFGEINNVLYCLNQFLSVFDKYKSSKDILSNLKNTNTNNKETNMEMSNYEEESESNSVKIKSTINGKDKDLNFNLRNLHWLTNFAVECLESDFNEIKSQLFILYESALDILNIICNIKRDINTYFSLLIYRKWYNDGYSLNDSVIILKFYAQIIKRLNILQIDYDEKNEYDYYFDDTSIENVLKVFYNNNFNFLLTENEDNEENNILKIDIYLLSILYNNLDNDYSGNKLDNKSLDILIQYFNEYNEIQKRLITMEFIINTEDETLFDSIYSINTRIIEMKNLILRDYISNQINKYNEQQINLNRLRDLKRNIDYELITRLDLHFKNINKLHKTQNICNHLKIHELLIYLLKILKDYDKNLNNSIFQFLYHFSYKCHANQLCLKKYFDFFLDLIPKYNYIPDVIMEILNLYKSSIKCEKYIDKIFNKIKEYEDQNTQEETKIIPNEYIEILNGLNYYKKQNIEKNQNYILQNFFKYKSLTIEILNNNFDFKKVLKEIKNKQIGYQKTLKSLYLQIKSIDLLSSCSYNNIFGIMNCRKLISIDRLVNLLISPYIPYMIKRSMLNFFKKVYYPLLNPKNNITFEINYNIVKKSKNLNYKELRNINLNKNDLVNYSFEKLYEILNNLIIPEINLFYFYSDIFIENLKSQYNNDMDKMPIDKKNAIKEVRDIILKTIKEDPDIKELLFVDVIDLRLYESNINFNINKYLSDKKNVEYMNFIFNQSLNYNLMKDGVIIFIYDLFEYIKINNIKLKFSQRSTIIKLKKKLNKLMDFLSILEDKLGNDNKILELMYQIQKCLTIAPKSNYENIVTNIAKKHKINGRTILFNIPLDQINNQIDKNEQLANINNESKQELIPKDNQNLLHIKKDENKKKKKIKFTQKELNNANKVLKLIQEYIIMNETSVPAIFNLLDTDNDKQIGKFEFKKTLKFLLNDKITNEEIDDTMNYIDTKQNNKISLKELSNYLQKFQKLNQRKKIKKDKNNLDDYIDVENKIDDISLKITQIFRNFLLSMHEMKIKFHENYLVSVTTKNLLKILVKKDKVSNTNFLKKYINFFKNSNLKKYISLCLLKLLKEMINIQYNINEQEINSENISFNRIKRTKNELIDSGIMEFIFIKISDFGNAILINEILDLFILTLKFNRNFNNFRAYVYKSLYNNPNKSFKFLNFINFNISRNINIIEKLINEERKNLDIKSHSNFYEEISNYFNKNIDINNIDPYINNSPNYICEKINESDETVLYTITLKILKVIELLCEKNFKDLQNFFRIQDYNLEINITEKTCSVNLIYEISSNLISMLKFENVIFYSNYIYKILSQSIKTLNELCMGNYENQLIVGNRTTLYKTINILLKNKFNFLIKEQINQRKNLILFQIIIFFKNIINKETIKDLGKIFLDEMDVFLLIEKLIDIYINILKPNHRLFLKGKLCNYSKYNNDIDESMNNVNIFYNKSIKKRVCTKNFCSNNFVSYNDVKFIDTSIYIFIILIYLKHFYPNHKKLKIFKVKNLNYSNLNLNNKKNKEKKENNNDINNENNNNEDNNAYLELDIQDENDEYKNEKKKNIEILYQKNEKENNNKNNINNSLNSSSTNNEDNDDFNILNNPQFTLNNKILNVKETLWTKIKHFFCCFYCKNKKRKKIESILDNLDIEELEFDENFNKDLYLKLRFLKKYNDYYDETYNFFNKNLNNIIKMYPKYKI